MLEKIPSPAPVSELRVLIVDNQALVHEIVTSALLEVGFKQIKSALNAGHAARLCEEQRFDFVLLAFNVSNDKDGFHLLEELKLNGHIDNKTTVIFLSAETSQELVNCIVELQPDDFWVKPLSRHHIIARLTYLIDIKRKLNKLLHCLETRNYPKAIYHAERQLQDPQLSDYHSRLRRIIGDCLIQLREFAEAERYYSKLGETNKYGWIFIGLARSLYKQNKVEEAEALVEDLLQRDDTRFLTYDLLAQYYIEQEQYDKAYEQIKHASKLAPRNIERNKKLWDLARLNHDRVGQLNAVQNMAKYAKNSVHDSPELMLNVIRTTIDLATSANDSDVENLIKKANKDIAELSARKGMSKALEQQFTIIKARLMCLQDNKKEAETLLMSRRRDDLLVSIEDKLDQMKAYHELGMKERCLDILDKLRTQIAGDIFSNQVVNEYLKQESIERKEINFTTKELKDMAAVNYRENRMLPAFNNLHQAYRLAPHNRQITLSLLKVLVQLNLREPLNELQYEVAREIIRTLRNESLSASQQSKFDEYCQALQLVESEE